MHLVIGSTHDVQRNDVGAHNDRLVYSVKLAKSSNLSTNLPGPPIRCSSVPKRWIGKENGMWEIAGSLWF